MRKSFFQAQHHLKDVTFNHPILGEKYVIQAIDITPKLHNNANQVRKYRGQTLLYHALKSYKTHNLLTLRDFPAGNDRLVPYPVRSQ